MRIVLAGAPQVRNSMMPAGRSVTGLAATAVLLVGSTASTVTILRLNHDATSRCDCVFTNCRDAFVLTMPTSVYRSLFAPPLPISTPVVGSVACASAASRKLNASTPPLSKTKTHSVAFAGRSWFGESLKKLTAVVGLLDARPPPMFHVRQPWMGDLTLISCPLYGAKRTCVVLAAQKIPCSLG